MNKKSKLRNTLIALGAVALFVGCTSSDKPELVTVDGKLTKGGQPFVDAVLEFYPEAKGGASYGKTDSEGKFTLYYTTGEKGAAIGRHSIQVIGGQVAGGKASATMKEGTGDAPSSMAAAGPTGGPTNPVKLTAEVTSGANDLQLSMP